MDRMGHSARGRTNCRAEPHHGNRPTVADVAGARAQQVHFISSSTCSPLLRRLPFACTTSTCTAYLNCCVRRFFCFDGDVCIGLMTTIENEYDLGDPMLIVQNLAVDPRYRRRGVAHLLLYEALTGVHLGIELIYLKANYRDGDADARYVVHFLLLTFAPLPRARLPASLPCLFHFLPLTFCHCHYRYSFYESVGFYRQPDNISGIYTGFDGEGNGFYWLCANSQTVVSKVEEKLQLSLPGSTVSSTPRVTELELGSRCLLTEAHLYGLPETFAYRVVADPCSDSPGQCFVFDKGASFPLHSLSPTAFTFSSPIYCSWQTSRRLLG